MKLDDLITEIRHCLGEPPQSMFTDEKIESYLKEAYEIAHNTYRARELTLMRLRHRLG